MRTIDRAVDVLDGGARKVILGSALFADGMPDLRFARELTDRLGRERLVAAVDARGGRVAIHGWRTTLSITPEDAVRELEPFFGEFLFTNVDREGLMQGIDRQSIVRLRRATRSTLTVAGGVTTVEEVRWLDELGIDAVVGMALYTGALKATPPHLPSSNPGGEENR